MLQLFDVTAGYGAIEVVHGVNMRVGNGQIVALLGPNGAGKSTLLKAVAGLMPVRAGHVEFEAERIENLASHRIVRRGLVLVPQDRELFPDMSVQENLDLGRSRSARQAAPDLADWIFELFPRLRERAGQRSGTLSGGERAMLAIGRGLISRPKLILLDEPTAGLAPILVEQVAQALRQIKATGQTVLLVEQNVKVALRVADVVYVLRDGRIVAEGLSEQMSDETALFESFVG